MIDGYVDVVGGAQYGDEGKGKVVDHLSEKATIVARVNGADNAGHTVEVNEKTYIMHLIPSGIVHDNIISLIGNGVLINPKQLLKEMHDLRNAGLNIDERKLRISDRAFVTFPHHKYLDVIRDSTRRNPIGTTGSGVGPTYASQMLRTGLRIRDLSDVNAMREALLDDKEEFDFYAATFLPKIQKNIAEGKYKGSKLEDITKFLTKTLPEFYDATQGLNINAIVDEYHKMGQELHPHVTNSRKLALDTLNSGNNILVELAQGAALDKDQGTYPYVTSSNCASSAVETGLGIPRRFIRTYVAVVKLTPSRVGEGPFEGEYGEYNDIRGKTRKELGLNHSEQATLREKINNNKATPFEVGQYFRNVGVSDDKSCGGEYGATTARPRRMGILDLTLVKKYNDTFGFTHLALTKLDVYDGITDIPIIVEGDATGKKKLVMLPGYYDTHKETSFEELHVNAQNLVHFVSEYLKLPVMTIATGAGRDCAIINYRPRTHQLRMF